MAASRPRAPRHTAPELADSTGDGQPLAHLFLIHRPALQREVACELMAGYTGGGRLKQRLVDVALPFDEAGAPRVEAARRRRVERARNVALEDDLLAGAAEGR